MYNEAIARAVLADRARERDSSLHANLMLGREHRRGTEPVVTDTLCVDGTALGIRPIELTDVDRLARMVRRLSPKSIYFRFAAPIRRLPWPMVLWLANVDHCRRDALVALHDDEIVAVARYDQLPDADALQVRDAEIAVTVADAWQRRGLGGQLANRLCALARERGYDAIRATILPENRPALDLMRKLVPDASVRFADGTYEARFPLRPDPDASHFAPA